MVGGLLSCQHVRLTKLTRTMQEREHTLNELNKMEQVRNYLINNQAIDADGFVDFLSEL